MADLSIANATREWTVEPIDAIMVALSGETVVVERDEGAPTERRRERTREAGRFQATEEKS